MSSEFHLEPLDEDRGADRWRGHSRCKREAGKVRFEAALAAGARRNFVFRATFFPIGGDPQGDFVRLMSACFAHVPLADVCVKTWIETSDARRRNELKELGHCRLLLALVTVPTTDGVSLDHKLPGAVHGFVMPYFGPSLDRLCLCGHDRRKRVADIVLRTLIPKLKLLHARKRVFFDLWPGNVAVQEASDGADDAHLIDYESTTNAEQPTTMSPIQRDFCAVKEPSADASRSTVVNANPPLSSAAIAASTTSEAASSGAATFYVELEHDWVHLGLLLQYILNPAYQHTLRLDKDKRVKDIEKQLTSNGDDVNAAMQKVVENCLEQLRPSATQ